MNSGIGSNDY